MYDNNKKSLTAERLKELREAKGLTFEGLAKTLDEKYGDGDNETGKYIISIGALKNYEVSEVHHSKFKTGYGMNVQFLSMFADFYNVSTDYLLGLTNSKLPDSDTRGIQKSIGLSDKAIQTLLEWNHIAKDNFLINGEDRPDNSIRVLIDPFAFEEQATIDFLLTNEKGKILLSYISDYLYGYYVESERSDNTSIKLHNKRLGYNKSFNTSLIKAGLLVNIQSILLACDKEINRKEGESDSNNNTQKE